MKTFITALLAVMLLATVSHATTVTLAPTDKFVVSTRNDVIAWEYTITSVPESTTARFKIPVPFIAGNIVQILWNSDSEDCVSWIATLDDQVQGSANEILAWKANGSYSPELSAPRYFRNRDTTEAAFLYLAVQNDDTVNATGAGKLVVIFGRQ